MVRGLGTVVNVATVAAGSVIGLLLGARLPHRIRESVFTGIGLIVVAVGVQSFLETRNAIFPLVSVVLGAFIGESLDLEGRLEWVGRALQQRITGAEDTFVTGFVTASITFCVGPLAVLGAIQDGIGAGTQLLVVKAALDGIVSVIYASTFGIGVAASVITIAIVQGSLTLLGVVAGHDVLTHRMIVELTSTGGIIIAGLGLRLLDLKSIRVASYLPGLVIAPVAVALFAR